jgi:nicotinate-nucleotide pyrophosphorylase (carboxylating)
MDHSEKLIRLALDEDVGTGDITTEATISENAKSKARIIAKKALVQAGVDVALRTFLILDPETSFSIKHADGSKLESGDVIAVVEGKTRALITAERTALNFLQRLSGIATHTATFVKKLKGTKTMLLDTRKTAPGMRFLEKHAVRMGGGTNHRTGLYDHFMIKNNHISATGSILKAAELAKKKRKPGQNIEIETRTLDEVTQALRADADIIMLDNMSLEDAKKAVKIIGDRAKIEASGNMTLDTVRAYAELGVDYISIGSITHSAPAADIHMLIDFIGI